MQIMFSKFFSLENVHSPITSFPFLYSFTTELRFLLKIATTTSSLIISSEPRAMKYSEVNTSPLWTSVSPGGAWVVLNFIDRALELIKCIVM